MAIFLIEKFFAMFYFYVEIRKKSRVVEYAIYSYDEDWAVNDCETVVTLSKGEDIGQYVREHFWPLLPVRNYLVHND